MGSAPAEDSISSARLFKSSENVSNKEFGVRSALIGVGWKKTEVSSSSVSLAPRFDKFVLIGSCGLRNDRGLASPCRLG